MSCRRTSWPLVAVFAAGHLASYLLPTLVSRLSDGLGLRPTEAGLVGSGLLLGSACAGFALAARVEAVGQVRAARAGLLLIAVGFGAAALTSQVSTVMAGAVVGGLGSGVATTVAACRIAGEPDPHRASTAGLFSVSVLAGLLYLTMPQLGGGHGLPFAAIAVTAVCALPAAGRLGAAGPAAKDSGTHADRLPFRGPGLVLAGGMALWAMAQNSLWGVSGRIGLDQVGMSEAAVGAVFATALGAGLLGVLAAGALGTQLGRALPTGTGTVLIGCCILLTACASSPAAFASGKITWNLLYPAVLSYLIGLAASLDARGRWAALTGSASALGTAFGPVVGSQLSALTGYGGMGLLLSAGMLLTVAPLAGVALHTAGRPLPNAAPQPAAPGREIVEIAVPAPRHGGRRDYGTAGPDGSPGKAARAGP